MASNAIFILQPMEQGVILTYKAYYLKICICKAIFGIDSNLSDKLGKVN